MKELIIIFFCTWKFAATFPVAVYVMKMSAIETLFYTNIGGIIGAFVFLHFSKFLIRMWSKYRHSRFAVRHRKKEIFTKANRKLVKIKSTYGLYGIVILSPIVLSIPVGSFLAAKYYGSGLKIWAWLITGQIFWSVIFTFFYTQFKNILV